MTRRTLLMLGVSAVLLAGVAAGVLFGFSSQRPGPKSARAAATQFAIAAAAGNLEAAQRVTSPILAESALEEWRTRALGSSAKLAITDLELPIGSQIFGSNPQSATYYFLSSYVSAGTRYHTPGSAIAAEIRVERDGNRWLVTALSGPMAP